MATILYCGDVGCQTGFGRVAENIIPALAKYHTVHALAVNWHGDPSPMQEHCKMYPAMAYGRDPFGSHRMEELVKKIKPDFIFINNDIWVALTLVDAVEHLKDEIGYKTCVYCPIDSSGIYEELLPAIEKWDKIITYTKFGENEIHAMGYKDKVEVVGHGTNFDDFFPMDRDLCRDHLGVPKDTFIVFNGNRNQPRKRIDLTIKGFVKFAKDKPDARLWLHMGKKDTGWEIVPLFRRVAKYEGYDSHNKLIITPGFSVDNCLPIHILNYVYNAADVGVNTCLGEGWGLVNTEHAATETAQIVPDHSSLKEIFSSVERIRIESYETDRNYGLERGQPSPDHFAQLLNRYYEDRDLLLEDGRRCYDAVHQKDKTWPYIQDQLLSIIDNLLKEPAQSTFKGFGTPARID